MTYMDHILTMHAQKGPWVWLEYDYRFRVRRERTYTSWNLFNYPSTPVLKQSVRQKQQTHLSRPSPFVNMLPEAPDHAPPVSVLSLTRGNVKGHIADAYMDVSSAKRRSIFSSCAGARQSLPTAEPITEPPKKKHRLR